MLQLLINHVKETPMTMAEWMNEVLYNEQCGYYMVDRVKIGRQGDFLTTSSLSSLYAEQLALFCYRIAEQENSAIHWLELGGGNGAFAQAFLRKWHAIGERSIRYTIVETSPYHRRCQRETITYKHESVATLQDVTTAEEESLLIFSNELFDAFPVHLIERRNGELVEKGVTAVDGVFRLCDLPTVTPGIDDYLTTYRYEIREGQQFEVPLAMMAFLAALNERFTAYRMMTVDYGYEREQWLEPEHRCGSLRGYYEHQMVENVILHPYEMDLTTHIHLTTLQEAQQTLYNVVTDRLLRQDEFLIESGIMEQFVQHASLNPFSDEQKRNRAIRQLIAGDSMSRAFSVLLQRRGSAVPLSAYLTKPY